MAQGRPAMLANFSWGQRLLSHMHLQTPAAWPPARKGFKAVSLPMLFS